MRTSAVPVRNKHSARPIIYDPNHLARHAALHWVLSITPTESEVDQINHKRKESYIHNKPLPLTVIQSSVSSLGATAARPSPAFNSLYPDPSSCTEPTVPKPDKESKSLPLFSASFFYHQCMKTPSTKCNRVHSTYYNEHYKNLTSVSPVNCIPITGEGHRCWLDSILPHHAPPSTIHVSTLHSSRGTRPLWAQVGEANSSTGRVESDGLHPTDAFLYENSSVCSCDGGHLQAGLLVAAPVDVKSHPVQGHGSDGVTQEF